MVVHIVMFKFKEHNKQENILVVKSKLEALVSQIPTLLTMEVGIDFNKSDRAFDLSLYSTFDTKDDMRTYAIHPSHLEVLEFIKSVTMESRVVDYSL